MKNTSKDREEPKEAKEVSIGYSVDTDTRWLVKRKKYYFGYKGFVATDDNDGYINHAPASLKIFLTKPCLRELCNNALLVKDYA